MKHSVLKLLEQAENAKKTLVFDLECELHALIEMCQGVGTELNNPSKFAMGRSMGFIQLLAEQVGLCTSQLRWCFDDSGEFNVTQNATIKTLNRMLADLEGFK